MRTRVIEWLRGRRWPLVALAALVVAAVGVATFLMDGQSQAVANGGTPRQCGAVHLVRETLVSNPDEAGRAAPCFAQAYTRCEPAALTVTRMSVDVSTTETFTIARSGGSCTITDKWSNQVNVRMSAAGTEHCAGLTTQADGLLIRACGTLGDRLVPTN